MKSSFFIRSIRGLHVISTLMTTTVVFSTVSPGMHDWLLNQCVYPDRLDADYKSIIWIYRMDAESFISLIKKLEDYGTAKEWW